MSDLQQEIDKLVATAMINAGRGTIRSADITAKILSLIRAEVKGMSPCSLLFKQDVLKRLGAE